MTDVSNRIAELKYFLKRRDRIRTHLDRLAERPEPKYHSRRWLRHQVYKLVCDLMDREAVYVLSAALAIDDVVPGIKGLPADHPMLWGIAAVLGRKQGEYFNRNYMRRFANELANAAQLGVAPSAIHRHMSSPARCELKKERTSSPHRQAVKVKLGKSERASKRLVKVKS